MARVTRSSTRNKTAAKPADEAAAAASKPTKKASPKKKATQVKAPKPAAAAKKTTKAKEEEAAVGNKAVVEINKEKPGKGNFVVRVSGVKDPIVELLGLKRPFPPLKALDMDDICAKVVEAIGGGEE